MAELWQSLEHRPLLHQLQHRRYQKPHQCRGGVLGVSWKHESVFITRILRHCEQI